MKIPNFHIFSQNSLLKSMVPFGLAKVIKKIFFFYGIPNAEYKNYKEKNGKSVRKMGLPWQLRLANVYEP